MTGKGNTSIYVEGTTAVYGLIGDPVEHTLSPLIHNTLARLTGQDMVYVPYRVSPEDVGDAIRGAYALGIQGLNVTVPHKISVMDHLVDVDQRARAIGAVNTLVRTDGGYVGYNTDYLGLKLALASDGISLSGRKVVILGAGGAARAAAFLCAFESAGEVYILNRSVDKAESLCRDVDAELCKPLSLDSHTSLPDDDMIVIQASSVGLHPRDKDVIISDESFYRHITYGYDMVYRPARTRFMELVESHGGRSACGLKMLMYQGIAAYEMWRDMQVPADAASKLYEMLKEASAV